MQMKGSSSRLDWGLATLTVVAIVGTVFGRRASLLVENVSFGILLVLIFLFVPMAWWRLRYSWRDAVVVRWRMWISLAGCVALSLALALPCIPFFGSFVRMGFGPPWDYKLLMFGFGSAAFLLGIGAARTVRFPLMLGGFMLGVIGLILPVGV